MRHLSASVAATSDGLTTGIGELVAAANQTVRELLAACPPGDPIGNRLARVEQTMHRLAMLTGQLHTSGRPVTPRATPLDLNSVVSGLSPSLQRLLGPFISLECVLHPGGVWAAADRGQIEQLVLGLVINAREALPLGGTVHVVADSLTLDRPRRFRIGSLEPGNWSVLEVRDNGSGIDERSIEHLFQAPPRNLPFDSSLSLSTVAAIVRDCGGKMVLQADRTAGSALAACFPAVRPSRTRQPATGTASAVLIVDDDEWARMSGARILRRAGFGVLEAEHVDAATELLHDVAGSCVRVVLVDAHLAQHGPVPFAEILRSERPEIELLATGDGGFSRSGETVVAKPFVADILVKAVSALLESQP
ncbi:MAG TPA: ATP-binding protein [Gemmatimonadales bacterium]